MSHSTNNNVSGVSTCTIGDLKFDTEKTNYQTQMK